MLPALPLELEASKFGAERAHLLRQVLVRLEPARARVGIHAEVADHQRGPGIEPDRGENGTQTLTHDHGPTMARAWLRLAKRRADATGWRTDESLLRRPFSVVGLPFQMMRQQHEPVVAEEAAPAGDEIRH